MFPLERSLSAMTKKEELLQYVSTLTPEQIDKVVSQLPRLNELLAEQAPLFPREQNSQNP